MSQAAPPSNYGIHIPESPEACEGGITVSHAMGNSAKSDAESYFIRIVYSCQECWVNDLIWELLHGEVGQIWPKYQDRPISDKYEPYTEEWRKQRKGFIGRVVKALLDEHMSMRCRQCNGTGYEGREIRGKVDGQYQTRRVVPQKCQQCGGEGVKKYSPGERARRIGIPLKLYLQHWHPFAQEIDDLFTRWEDQVGRQGSQWMWGHV